MVLVILRIKTVFLLFECEQTCGVLLSVLIMRSDTMMHDEDRTWQFSPWYYRYGMGIINDPRSFCFFHSGSFWSRGEGHVTGLRSGPFRR